MSSPRSVPAATKVLSDASLRHGAWIDCDGRQKTFAIPPQEFQYTSYASEFYVAQQDIRDIAPLSNHIQLYCDNQGVYFIIRNQRTAHPARNPRVEELFNSLLSFIDNNDIHLSISHVPSQCNPADHISRRLPIHSDCMQAERLLSSDIVQSFLK